MKKRTKKGLWIVLSYVLILALLIAGTALWFLQKGVCHLSLSLNGNRDIYSEYGQRYQEQGADALFHKNSADIPVSTATAGAVKENKTESPVITLFADPNSYKLKSQSYVEENFAAVDMTKQVIRTETADSITYTVTDSSGSTAIVPNGKTIYLTFDDGPSAHTARLLDVLNKYGVKATFFVIQTSHIDMITRAAQEGHTVAIHSYTHNYGKIFADDDAYMNDLQAMQNVIVQYTGQQSMLMRFPGGSSNSVSSAYNKGIMTRLTKNLQAMGYRYFDWNVDSNDAGGARSADEVFQNVIKGVSGRTNSVVLQHDTQSFSVDAVEKIIAWGLCNGYTFAPLSYDSPSCHHYVRN